MKTEIIQIKFRFGRKRYDIEDSVISTKITIELALSKSIFVWKQLTHIVFCHMFQATFGNTMLLTSLFLHLGVGVLVGGAAVERLFSTHLFSAHIPIKPIDGVRNGPLQATKVTTGNANAAGQAGKAAGQAAAGRGGTGGRKGGGQGGGQGGGKGGQGGQGGQPVSSSGTAGRMETAGTVRRMCDECDVAVATLYCHNCDESFCCPCDIHPMKRKWSHRITPITPTTPTTTPTASTASTASSMKPATGLATKPTFDSAAQSAARNSPTEDAVSSGRDGGLGGGGGACVGSIGGSIGALLSMCAGDLRLEGGLRLMVTSVTFVVVRKASTWVSEWANVSGNDR